MLKTATSMLIVVAGVAAQSEPRERATHAPQPAAPAIAVKEIPPARLIYLEHTGPYWTVGASLAEVRQYMNARNLTGSMFVRFPTNPMTTPASTLTAQVGVMLPPDVAGPDSQPPFKTELRGPEVVAFQILDSEAAPRRRDFDTIIEWVADHGHRAAGPVMEIFHTYPPGADPGAVQIELQFTLTRGETAPGADAPTTAVPEARTQSPSPSDGSIPGSAASVGIKPPSVVVPEAEHTGPSSPATIPQRDDVPARMDRTAPVGDNESAEPPPSEVQYAGQTTDDPRPIADLMHAEEFERIAGRLMPGDCAVRPSFQIWLSQVVFRLGAAAKGVKQLYPDQERLVAGAAEAIARRYKSVSAGFESDPLGHAVGRIDVPTDDPIAEQRRAMMRDLDRFLGRIAFRSIDAGDLVAEFAGVLERCEGIMRAHGCDTSPSESPTK